MGVITIGMGGDGPNRIDRHLRPKTRPVRLGDTEETERLLPRRPERVRHPRHEVAFRHGHIGKPVVAEGPERRRSAGGEDADMRLVGIARVLLGDGGDEPMVLPHSHLSRRTRAERVRGAVRSEPGPVGRAEHDGGLRPSARIDRRPHEMQAALLLDIRS